MFSFLLPERVRRIRHGRELYNSAKKLLSFKRDLWSTPTVDDYESHLSQLDKALKTRDVEGMDREIETLDGICKMNLPTPRDEAMRENVEVFLVAIVIALAVRTYFLQPFTIPTGSMQPTLNGIIWHPQTEPAPNPLGRIFTGAILGRSYVDIVAQEDTEIIGAREFKSPLPFVERTPGVESAGFFPRTELQTTHGTYVIKQAFEAVARQLPSVGRTYRAGETILRGYFSTGDHVFVDKMSYHFRKPHRAEVFVFNTAHLPTNENRMHPDGPSQFYIKRLAGVPDDQLRIDKPRLFVNGQLAEDARFRRVMDMKEPDYNGYCNGRDLGFSSGILTDPDTPFTVPPKNYFALGDNSYHSSDSRDWGPVPEQNLMGHGVFVYWPFGAHWGFIR